MHVHKDLNQMWYDHTRSVKEVRQQEEEVGQNFKKGGVHKQYKGSS